MDRSKACRHSPETHPHALRRLGDPAALRRLGDPAALRRLSGSAACRRLGGSAALATLIALAGCSSGSNPQVNNMRSASTSPAMLKKQEASGGPGNLLSLNLGGSKNQNTGIPVNAYLWRASLDTLSFMPLASANPFAGVIVTDWYSPPSTPDERFKATAYILGKQLTANDIKVSVFRQVRKNGGWSAASVNPATVSGIEDRILARAAQLKGAGQQNG